MRPEFGPDIFESRAQASAAREAQIERSRDIADEIGLTPQEISEIEANADNISLFGRVKDWFGGFKWVQSTRVRIAATVVMLGAVGSACDPVRPGSDDDPEKTPTVLRPEPRETSTPLVIPTVIRTPVETKTPAPTDTAEPTRTPTKEPTEKPTPNPTPSETPSPTDTPTTEPTPENILEQEPFVSIFKVLESDDFEWSKYSGGRESEVDISSIKNMIGKADKRAFEMLVNYSSALLIEEKDLGNYPALDENSETPEHKRLREQVIVPYQQWLETKYKDDPEMLQHIKDVLAMNPYTFQPELLKNEEKPFKKWREQIMKKAIPNSQDKVLNDFLSDQVDIFDWMVTSGNFATLGGEIAANGCTNKGLHDYFKYLADDLLPEYLDWLKLNTPSNVQEQVDNIVQQVCPS